MPCVVVHINYHFPLFCCLGRKLCSAAVGVGDIGDDIVGLLKYPVVAPGDGVVWVAGHE